MAARVSNGFATVMTVSSSVKATRNTVMIVSRRAILDFVVVKCCNNHKGPMSIASPSAIVMQVTSLSMIESLLYTVVSEGKFSSSLCP